jgi:hypothetical protein
MLTELFFQSLIHSQNSSFNLVTSVPKRINWNNFKRTSSISNHLDSERKKGLRVKSPAGHGFKSLPARRKTIPPIFEQGLFSQHSGVAINP